MPIIAAPREAGAVLGEKWSCYMTTRHVLSILLIGFVATGIPVYYLTQAEDKRGQSRATCEYQLLWRFPADAKYEVIKHGFQAFWHDYNAAHGLPMDGNPLRQKARRQFLRSVRSRDRLQYLYHSTVTGLVGHIAQYWRPKKHVE